MSYDAGVGRRNLVDAEKGLVADQTPVAAGKHQRTGGIAYGTVVKKVANILSNHTFAGCDAA